jgi:ribosome-associated protein YbcJ (S4-like RNA binding protein)
VRLSPNDAGVNQILKTVSVTRSGGQARIRTVRF